MKYEVRLHPDWPHTNVAYVFSDGKEVATFYGGGRTPDEVKRLATEAAAGMNRREDAQSLRDHFAGMALAGYSANKRVMDNAIDGWVESGGERPTCVAEYLAGLAYEVADAMLAERANRPAQFLGSPNAVKSEIERDVNAVQVNKAAIAALKQVVECEGHVRRQMGAGPGAATLRAIEAAREMLASAEGGAS